MQLFTFIINNEIFDGINYQIYIILTNFNLIFQFTKCYWLLGEHNFNKLQFIFSVFQSGFKEYMYVHRFN